MPNNEMDYSLIHRTPDGNGKILVTTPGSPDKGSWETEAELKTYVNQDVNTAINAINTRVTNIEETIMGENEITVQYPSDSTYSSLMPNRVPLRALKFAEIPTIKGKTRAWNQILPPSAQGSTVVNDVTIASDGNGAYTLNGTASSYIYTTIKTSFQNDMFVGHKYLIFCNSPSGNVYLADSYSNKFDVNSAAIFDYTTAVTIWIGLHVRGGATVNETVKPMVRDLTLIFGSGNEPSTVADALAQLPALGEYNAYDAGSLVDTVVSGVKSEGVNIWDEEWENKALNGADGTKYSYPNSICSKNPVKVFPNTTYYFKVASNSRDQNLLLCEYSADGTYLGYHLPTINNPTYTTRIDTAYIQFYWDTSDVVGEYDHTFQICLNSYADKTIYHPYKTDTLSLPEPVTLRSAGAVSEVLTLETGKKTRPVGTIDLGSKDYTLLSSGYDHYFLSTTTIDDIMPDTMNALAGEYVIASSSPYGDMPNLSIRIESNKYITIKNEAYDASIPADIASFKASLSGVYLYYEKATPDTDEQVCDPIIDNFLEVEGGGTVETIQTQTPIIDNCLDVTYDIIPQ